MGIVKSIVITLLSIVVLAWVIPSVTYGTTATLVMASIVLTFLQKIVQPALKILFLPINLITLGIFSWVINALIFWLLMIIVPGFHIDPISIGGLHLNSFFTLVLASFLISLIQSVIDTIF